MSQVAPLRLVRVTQHDEFGGDRLERLLGAPARADRKPVSALVDLPPPAANRLGLQTIAYVDATRVTPVWISSADLVIHVLWTTSRAVLRAGIDPAEANALIEYPCAPGDSLLVRAGEPFGIGAGNLAVIIGAGSLARANGAPPGGPPPVPFAPTHGLNVFHRFNRQTIGVATTVLMLCRWKLTQPQTLALPPDRDTWVSNLVAPVAITWPGGTDLLPRTGSLVIPAGVGPVTLVPDRLGYVLVAWQPDIDRDVLTPLRSAGYTRPDIAALGIPEWYL